jgi:two-component system NtrC family sensor kinase
MRPWTSVVDAVRRTVRYKLLVLVLFPILLALPVALALAVYWGERFGSDQLFIKVSTDLSVGHDVFERAQRDYLDTLARLAESYNFRTDFEREDDVALKRDLKRVAVRSGFTFLHLTDRQGRRMLADGGSSRPSGLVERALLGEPAVGIEIFSAADLAGEDPALAEKVRLRLVPTARAEPTLREVEDRAMVIRAVYPVRDANENVRAVLDGGMVLNRNFSFVDSIRDLVYGPGNLPARSIGAVTVFLDDVRISTNVPLSSGERTLGTRVSREVREQVLGRGENWIDRSFVVNDWYISAYEPIKDVNGARVGMLYAGFLEAPFRRELFKAMTALVLLFLALASVTAVVAVAGARSIFKPLEAMMRVVKATRAGEERRIGPVRSQDEIGELARGFDAMLDLLRDRNQQIRESAESLERKVEQRTAQLKRRNAELERTVRLLRETRRQLVMAEKLAGLGELTAGMAHEINNPMAVILGNLDLLVQELGPAAEPVRQEVDLIIEQVYRVRDIIESLLRFARPSEYAGSLNTLDVNQVLTDSLKLVSHLTRKAGIEVRLDLSATRQVRIGLQDLQQVVVNLLVNAAHVLEETGGVIRLSSRDWEDKGVVLGVGDTGPGIRADLAEKVFSPFFSTKPVGQGTGLGLSISYALIRRYGGNITLESSPGAGTELLVWLLAEPEPGEEDTALAEQLRLIGSGGGTA